MRTLIHDIISEQYLVPHIPGANIFNDMCEFYRKSTTEPYSSNATTPTLAHLTSVVTWTGETGVPNDTPAAKVVEEEGL